EASDRDPRDRLAVPASERAPDAEVVDYVRTAWAQHDGRGEHCDPWREVVREVTPCISRDWSLWDGLSTVEHMIKMGDENGGTPLPWLEVRDRVISSTDRTCIRTKGLLSAVNYVGSRDQTSLASMLSIKVLCHRVSQNVEAYSSDPTKLPKRGGPRRCMGVTGPRGDIDPALRSVVFRRNKEEMELGDWKSRAAGVSVMSRLALEAGGMAALAGGGGRPAGSAQPAREVGVGLLSLFPLPRLDDREGNWPQLQSRGAARLARRARQDFNEVVDALNWLVNRTTTGAKPNFGQMRVHARILECVGDSLLPLETAIPSPRAAFSELLRGRGVYGESAGQNVGLYVRMIKLLYSKGMPVFLDEAERREEAESDGIQGGADLGFTLAASDISDAFHRFRTDRGLSGYFCMRCVTAQEVGLVGAAVGGLAAAPDRRLVPACAAPPMGFTWSRYFCQEVGEAAMGTAPELERAHRMSDRGPATALRPPAPLAEGGGAQCTYVDNLGALGFTSGDVASGLAAATARFDAAGLTAHETEIQEGRGETLGRVLDGSSLTTRLTAKRYWRVRQGIPWALGSRALPGWVWEVILVHCAYCAMCDSDLLSVLNAICKFIAAHYHPGAPLWPSARAELVAFWGPMPLLRGDWALPRCPLVCISDASEHGYAVSASLFDQAAVKEIGRVQGRS
ncbi:unnamed protein product, partial [Prorocentrum cordatum]